MRGGGGVEGVVLATQALTGCILGGKMHGTCVDTVGEPSTISPGILWDRSGDSSAPQGRCSSQRIETSESAD